MYDILIKNATIYDGTGAPPIQGSVLVKDGVIAQIGQVDPQAEAFHVIDAKGLCVSPGFVDPHTHHDVQVIQNKQMAGTLYQGVTTVVVGLCGVGLTPNNGDDIQDLLRLHSGLCPFEENVTYDWTDMEGYLRKASGAGVNVAAAVGHGALRAYVGAYSEDVPYESVAQRMKDALRENIRQGAVGLSIGPDYYPHHTDVVTTQELMELCRVTQEEQGTVLSHVRPNSSGINGMDELEKLGLETGVRMHILHTKTHCPGPWDDGSTTEERMKRVNAQGGYLGHPEIITDRWDAANAAGGDFSLEFYPWPGWETQATYFLPYWALSGGYKKIMERLGDPALRTKLAQALEEGYFFFMAGDLPATMEGVKGHPEYQGKTYEEVARLRKQSIGEMILDLMYESELGMGALAADVTDPVIYKMIQDDFMKLFQNPSYTIGSDSNFNGTMIHPRGFGAFAKLLRLSREYGYPLERTIYKLTKFTADRFRLDRGVLAVGKPADIIAFDYEKVRETSTYQIPRNPALGMEWVIVNGQVALINGRPNGNLNGRGLKPVR